MLCCDSHNNLIALISRHIEKENENDFSVVFYKSPNSVMVSQNLIINLELFLRATRLVHEFFNSTVQEKIERRWRSFEEFSGNLNNAVVV